MSFRQVIEQLVTKVLIVVIILHASSTFVEFFLKGPYRLADLLFLWLPAFVVCGLWYSVAQVRAFQHAKTWGERYDASYFLGVEHLKYLPGQRLSQWVMPILILGVVTAVVRLEWSASTILFGLLVYRWVRDEKVSEAKRPR